MRAGGPGYGAAMIKLTSLVVFVLSLAAGPSLLDRNDEDTEARTGSLLAVGGGAGAEMFELFVELAGGAEARIVVIPTAAGAASYSPAGPTVRRLRALGVDVIEAPYNLIGTRLIDAYLEIKRAGAIG